MAWILTAVLAAVAVNFVLLYLRAIREQRNLTSLVIQILLDDETYRFQQDGLRKLVAGMQVKDAIELSTKVRLSISQFADRVAGPALLSSGARLWNLKQQAQK